MERNRTPSPRKRRRIDEDDEDGQDLAHQQRSAAIKLGAAWKTIAEKYASIPDNEEDVIDLTNDDENLDREWERTLEERFDAISPNSRWAVSIANNVARESSDSEDELGHWADSNAAEVIKPLSKAPSDIEKSFLNALKKRQTSLLEYGRQQSHGYTDDLDTKEVAFNQMEPPNKKAKSKTISRGSQNVADFSIDVDNSQSPFLKTQTTPATLSNQIHRGRKSARFHSPTPQSAKQTAQFTAVSSPASSAYVSADEGGESLPLESNPTPQYRSTLPNLAQSSTQISESVILTDDESEILARDPTANFFARLAVWTSPLRPP